MNEMVSDIFRHLFQICSSIMGCNKSDRRYESSGVTFLYVQRSVEVIESYLERLHVFRSVVSSSKQSGVSGTGPLPGTCS